MANANLKARPPVTERFVTIQEFLAERNSRGRYDPPTLFPLIRLASKWPQHEGFTAGQRVTVHVEHGRLITTEE